MHILFELAGPSLSSCTRSIAFSQLLFSSYPFPIITIPSLINYICMCVGHQDSDGQGCPFCRTEIKGTEQVVVDPFDPVPPRRVTSNHNSPSSSIIDDDDDTFEVSVKSSRGRHSCLGASIICWVQGSHGSKKCS